MAGGCLIRARLPAMAPNHPFNKSGNLPLVQAFGLAAKRK